MLKSLYNLFETLFAVKFSKTPRYQILLKSVEKLTGAFMQVFVVPKKSEDERGLQIAFGTVCTCVSHHGTLPGYGSYTYAPPPPLSGFF
jgi:hypothetical protein